MVQGRQGDRSHEWGRPSQLTPTPTPTPTCLSAPPIARSLPPSFRCKDMACFMEEEADGYVSKLPHSLTVVRSDPTKPNPKYVMAGDHDNIVCLCWGRATPGVT